jgi:hypothetical protein
LAPHFAERAKAEEAQYEKDLGALIALEDEHGSIASVKVSRFVAGQPTRAFLRTPNAAEYKRYKDLVFRAAADKRGIVGEQSNNAGADIAKAGKADAKREGHGNLRELRCRPCRVMRNKAQVAGFDRKGIHCRNSMRVRPAAGPPVLAYDVFLKPASGTDPDHRSGLVDKKGERLPAPPTF